MKTKISFLRIATNFLLAVMVAFFAAPMVAANPLAIIAGVFIVGTGSQLLSVPSQVSGALYMGLQTEVWVRDIMETLFYENEFLNLAVNHSEYVKNKTVHVPQSGGKPNVEKNRVENVADIERRTDTELTYNLDNYTTDPFLVKNIEELQISYNKRQSVMSQHIATLGDVVAVETLQKWAVTGSTTHVLRTTGGVGAMMPHATATGQRGLLTTKDFALAAAQMDIDKVPKAGRFAVVPTNMFYGLFTDKELVNQQALVKKDMLSFGVIAKLMGFNLITRGEVVRYTSAAANNIRNIGAANAATDCSGVVCFSRYMVSQALGEIMVYLNEGDAKSYGDIMSTEVNHAAHYLREGNVGRITIVQRHEA